MREMSGADIKWEKEAFTGAGGTRSRVVQDGQFTHRFHVHGCGGEEGARTIDKHCVPGSTAAVREAGGHEEVEALLTAFLEENGLLCL
jgi:hypothetical protein